jgi:uncharacterized protein (DUF1501 family)
MKRREFIQKSSLGAIGSHWVPNFIQASAKELEALTEKILVVIQLSGGNDGLNTIVPYSNDAYFKARPQIALKDTDRIPLNEHLALNKGLEALEPWYKEGNMSIINNVGYPNPDRSHFRSMDIWQSASNSDQYLNTGWLGRFLDHACNTNCKPYLGVEIDDTLSLALKGEQVKGIATTQPNKLVQQLKNKTIAQFSHFEPHPNANSQVQYLYKTLYETQTSAKKIQKKTANSAYKRNFYPNSALANHLKTTAELIVSDTPTQIYYLNFTGFDTHVNQLSTHKNLLQTYSEAVNAFLKDLKENNKFKDVAVLTFSEFGRRVKQNAGRGTDHGTASNVFLFAENLKKPQIVNELPNLTDLDNGDLKYTLDFRQIYSSLLSEWLESQPNSILLGQYPALGLL